MRNRFWTVAAVFVVAISVARLRGAEPATEPTTQVTVVTDHPQAIYTVGEQARFLISVEGSPLLPADAEVRYILDKDGLPPVKEGKVNLEQGHATVEGTLSEPGFLRCRITYAGVEGQKPSTAMASAAFDPLKIAPSLPVPDDFDAFWAQQKARLAAIPMTPKLTPVASGADGVESFDVQIPCVGPKPVTGYFSRPKAPAAKKFAGDPTGACGRRA